ncbi:phage head-tail connector protein [Paenalkalicoccus suaedae]|uniref:Phage head-tail connector protein n=1 Tax=Paenalkalicoccus suaedae TaxID=2592382 RepID=A0A859FGG2_9BACI|nr:head-tail connector protein [Paenalkalicoccus suaedae]QKS71908.1 phage head-tail connector protein [Paenalkalicoccus suaedae]
MALTIVHQPTTADEPISLEMLKEHLRLDDTEEEEEIYLQGIIVASRDYAEGKLRRSIAKKTYRLTLDQRDNSLIELPVPPVVELVSISTYDRDDSEVILDETDYFFDRESEPARIIFKNELRTRKYNAIKMEFISGWLPEEVPGAIKSAIKLIAANMYENREPVALGPNAQKIPFTVDSLLSIHRFWGGEV